MSAGTADEPSFGPRPPLTREQALRQVHEAGARAVVLVEGWSDQAALLALASRRGRALDAQGVLVLPIGGITNLVAFMQALSPVRAPDGAALRLAGLWDRGEEAWALRAMERCGAEGPLTRAGAEALGFFVCEEDLEDELIRALGSDGVEGVLQADGELASFRRFQAQPMQRGRDLSAQLRRFMGTRAGRKIRYGRLLAEAVDLERLPRPLDAVLQAATATG